MTGQAGQIIGCMVYHDVECEAVKWEGAHHPYLQEIPKLEIFDCGNLIFFFLDGAQKGVDSSQSSDHALVSAKALALECHCVVVVTGKDDFVTDGCSVITVSNGHPVLTKITAAGCALTAVLAAFVSLGDPRDVTHVMRSCACALSVFGIAAELAVKDPAVKGPGSARLHMLDAYSSINIETLSQLAKFS